MVTLHLLRQSQLLPGAYQEGHDVVHLAAVDQLDGHREVEDVSQHQEVVARGVALEVTWSNAIHLVQLIGILGFRPWIFAAGQALRDAQRRAVQPGTGDEALDGAQAGQRGIPEDLEEEACRRDENAAACRKLTTAGVDVEMDNRFISPGALGHNKFLMRLDK